MRNTRCCTVLLKVSPTTIDSQTLHFPPPPPHLTIIFIFIQHFFEEGHSSLNDFRAQIIDVIDVNTPTERESFCIEKLNAYVPLGLCKFGLAHG